MKDKIDNYIKEHPILKQMIVGTFFGAIARVITTPFNNFSNLILELTPTGQLRKIHRNPNMMSGAISNALSAAPTYTTAFGLRTYFKRFYDDKTWLELPFIFTAGFMAGFLSTPFELLAQARSSLKIKSTIKALQLVATNNTPFTLFRGFWLIGLRDASWHSTYISILPKLSDALQGHNLSHLEANAASAILTGGTFGLFTPAVNAIRFEKQGYAAQPSCAPTYRFAAKKLLTEKRMPSLFGRSALYAAATNAASAYVLNELISARP